MLRGWWRGKGKKEKSSQNPGNDYFSRDTQPIKRLKKPFRIASVQTVLRGNCSINKNLIRKPPPRPGHSLQGAGGTAKHVMSGRACAMGEGEP